MRDFLLEWQAGRLAHLEYREMSAKADCIAFKCTCAIILGIIFIDYLRIFGG